MANTKRVLAVDCDDILVEFMAPLFEFHNNRYGTTLKYEELLHFELEHFFGCGMEEKLRRILEFYLSVEHTQLVPVDGAVEALGMLSKTHIIHMVTARPIRVLKVTEALLERHFPKHFEGKHFTDHYFAKPGERTSKADICLKLGARAFIDDGLHNAIEVARVGIPVFLYDRPWNQGELSANITRVHSWREIVEQLAA